MNRERSSQLLARVEFPAKPIHVIGLGRFGGNLALVRYLTEKGHQIILWESSTQENLQKSWNQLSDYHDQIEARWSQLCPTLPKDDWVFITPAIPFTHECLKNIPKDHISTEIELSLSLAERYGTIIHAVLGSVGKSTCAALLKEALESELIGNIGKSYLSLLPDPPAELVVELSSFQLHYLKSTQWIPYSFLVTPIADHHSDWHGGLEEYQKAKLDWVDLWEKNEISSINFKNFQIQEQLFNKDVPNLIGEHNFKNIQAVWALVKKLGRNNEQTLKKLLDFKGLPHRLELCFDNQNIKCYNDSKATSPSATIASLNAFNSVHLLILHGNLKELNYRALIAKALEKCLNIWLIGGMAELQSHFSKAQVFDSLGAAFEQGTFPDYGNILLSPAASSYGEYSNYEERGEHFKTLITQVFQSDHECL